MGSRNRSFSSTKHLRHSEKKSKQKTEISKDVSAFANATGGQLIYGIAEKGRKAVELDDGVDPAEISKE